MWDNIGYALHRCTRILYAFRSSCRRSGFCFGLCLDLRFVFRSLHLFRSSLCFQIFASIQIFALFSILVLPLVASLLVFVYELLIVASSDRFSSVITSCSFIKHLSSF